MIILKGIVCEYLQSVQVELPRANMVIDPRSNYSRRVGDFPRSPRFRCEYHDNGTTVTLTRPGYIVEDYNEPYSFRVYDPATETVPSFDSTIYTYFGLDGEWAPYDTTILIIHPSVRVIEENAFSDCKYIEKCYMHDGVQTIEARAFQYCSAMKVIRLSRSLTHIGAHAFHSCSSLEAVFLPPTVNQIDREAFSYCQNIRTFPLPLNMDISQIGKGILSHCNKFFQTTQIQRYAYPNDSNRVHQEIIHFYRNQVPPLHKACLHTNVTHQAIQECINTHGQATVSITDHDGMTPLHILAMNPHADISALLACFHTKKSIAFVEDSRGNTPLDYLRVHRDGIEDHTSLVSSLCMHRYAVSSSQDDQKTSTNKDRKRKRSTDE